MKGLVRFCYHKVIDSSSAQDWERMIFNDTHLEYFMQAQRIDPEGLFPTFSELQQNQPEASQLHNRVSASAINYLREFKDIIPDILNSTGGTFLPFHNFKFEIIQSHNTDKSKHQIAIDFISDYITWIDNIGDHLLVSIGDQQANIADGREMLTQTVSLKPNFYISHFSKILP